MKKFFKKIFLTTLEGCEKKKQRSEKMKKHLQLLDTDSPLGKINLQLFAGEGDGDTDIVDPVTPPDTDEPEDGEVDMDTLKKKMNITIKENVKLTEKMEKLEELLTKQDEQLSQFTQVLKTLVPKQEPPKKKTKAETDDEITTTLELVLAKNKQLEDSLKAKEEKDFIKEELTNKPWLKKAVEKTKVATKSDFIRMIMPLEDELKEKYELEQKIASREDNDILREYGIHVPSSNSQDTKIKQQQQLATTLGSQLIDDYLR
jgi:hypothetical protein